MNFSDLNTNFPSSKTVKTVLKTLKHALLSQAGKLARVEHMKQRRWLDQLRPDILAQHQGRRVRELKTLHSSNAIGRAALSREAIERVPPLLKSEPGPFYFITLVHSDWETPEHAPIIDLTDIKRRSAMCASLLGFEGIMVIEFDLLRNGRPDREGGTICPHLHGWGRFNSKAFRKRARKLASSKRLRHDYGLRTIKIKRIKDTPGDAALVAFYCTKPFYQAKRQSPAKIVGNHPKTRTCRATARQTARLLEVMSYLSFRDLLISRGPFGWHCRTILLEALGPAATSRTATMLPAGQLRRFWRGYWKASGVHDYHAVSVR